MNEGGISLNEACAKRAELGSGYLTDEDFANQCNPDGTVKQTSKTQTFSIKDTDSSVTVNNNYMYIGGAVFVTLIVVLIWLVVRKKSNPKVSK